MQSSATKATAAKQAQQRQATCQQKRDDASISTKESEGTILAATAGGLPETKTPSRAPTLLASSGKRSGGDGAEDAITQQPKVTRELDVETPEPSKSTPPRSPWTECGKFVKELAGKTQDGKVWSLPQGKSAVGKANKLQIPCDSIEEKIQKNIKMSIAKCLFSERWMYFNDVHNTPPKESDADILAIGKKLQAVIEEIMSFASEDEEESDATVLRKLQAAIKEIAFVDEEENDATSLRKLQAAVKQIRSFASVDKEEKDAIALQALLRWHRIALRDFDDAPSNEVFEIEKLALRGMFKDVVKLAKKMQDKDTNSFWLSRGLANLRVDPMSGCWRGSEGIKNRNLIYIITAPSITSRYPNVFFQDSPIPIRNALATPSEGGVQVLQEIKQVLHHCMLCELVDAKTQGRQTNTKGHFCFRTSHMSRGDKANNAYQEGLRTVAQKSWGLTESDPIAERRRVLVAKPTDARDKDKKVKPKMISIELF